MSEQVWCESLHDLALEETTQHHLQRVLRLREGTRLVATDGKGSWRWVRWVRGNLEPDGPNVYVSPRSEALTVAVALSKSEKPEWVVQKLTEMGISRVGFVLSERVIVKWDERKHERMMQRFREIAKLAMNQSRQYWLPEILSPVEYAKWSPKVIADFAGEPIAVTDTTVLIGPEGGWSDAERSQADRHVSLGDTVLRCETAALVAGALLVRVHQTL